MLHFLLQMGNCVKTDTGESLALEGNRAVLNLLPYQLISLKGPQKASVAYLEE